jgi:hypothetical protein
MNLSNLFDYCDDSLVAKNVLFDVTEMGRNYASPLGVANGKILTYSNEFLYLYKNHHQLCQKSNWAKKRYRVITSQFAELAKTSNRVAINEKALLLVPTFNRGTAHGYAYVYNLLDEYFSKRESYRDHKILVYGGSQKGMLDITDHLVENKQIRPGTLVKLRAGVVYQVKELALIRNKSHGCDPSTVGRLICDHFDLARLRVSTYPSNRRIAIIKNAGSQNVTNQGVFPLSKVIQFCQRNGLLLVEPSKCRSEIELIKLVANAELLVFSWGTSFFKNMAYVSDRCGKVVVLVPINCPAFSKEYRDSLNNKTIKYKVLKAEISYKVLNANGIANLKVVDT